MCGGPSRRCLVSRACTVSAQAHLQLATLTFDLYVMRPCQRLCSRCLAGASSRLPEFKGATARVCDTEAVGDVVRDYHNPLRSQVCLALFTFEVASLPFLFLTLPALAFAFWSTVLPGVWDGDFPIMNLSSSQACA